MQKLNLPRGYLSYSSVDKWLKSKKEFRKMYYEGTPLYLTPQLEFGKRIGKQYELLHSVPDAEVEYDVIRRIPRGDIAEKELRFEICGIPFVGYIDSFNTSDYKIHELKTGSGKYPWTQSKVNRHTQLVVYCIGSKAIFGEYNPYVNLHWVETDIVTTSDIIDGISFPSTSMRLTGNLLSLTRIVHHNDMMDYQKLVVKVAREISEDFTMWTRLHPTT